MSILKFQKRLAQVTFDFTSIEGSNEPDLSKLLSKPQKTKLPDVLKSRSRLGKIDVNNLKVEQLFI